MKGKMQSTLVSAQMFFISAVLLQLCMQGHACVGNLTRSSLSSPLPSPLLNFPFLSSSALAPLPISSLPLPFLHYSPSALFLSLSVQIPPAPPKPDFESPREKMHKLGEGEATMTKEEYTKMKQELEA